MRIRGPNNGIHLANLRDVRSTHQVPKCGNNTCNSGHGEVDGKPCDVCPEAQRIYRETEIPYEFKLTDDYIRWSREEAYRLKEMEEDNDGHQE